MISDTSAPSKSLSLSNIHSPTGPKPLHLVDGTAPGFHSQNFARTSRRQSSITYKRSSYDSSTTRLRSLDESDLPSRPLYDEPRRVKPRPRSVAYPPSFFSSIPRDRRSLGPELSTAGLLVEDRQPLTLAEKHADLLRFIAQKESKCLELRSQLAVHEAELLELKRKWERIVSRGFESPHSFSASSSPASSTTHNPPTTYTSSASAPNSATNAVIEGIKGGMQGVSRLLTASLSITNPGEYPHSLSTNSIDTTTTAATTATIRPRLRPTPTSTPLKPRKSPHSLYFPTSHSTSSHTRSSNLSTSSSSTTTTTTTTTSGTRFSATSLSSTSSFFFEEPEKRHEPEFDNGGNDEKSAEQTPAQPSDCQDSDRGGSPYSSSSCSQELIVRDTGATPTVSPNPRFKFRLGRRREREREKERRKELDKVQLEGRGENENLNGGTSILGGLVGMEDPPPRGHNDEEVPAASSSAIDAARTTRCHRRKSREASSLQSQDDLLGPASPRGLSPNLNNASSKSNQTATLVDSGDDSALFGLGPPSVPIVGHNDSGGGVLQTQPTSTSSWMGIGTSRGWGSATLTKSQKRASLLFSDVSQTLVSAFSSVAGTGSASTRSPLSSSSSPLATRGYPAYSSASISLLDQDEEEGGFLSSTCATLEPMKPSALGLCQGQNLDMSRTGMGTGTATGTTGKEDDDDDDLDWGW